MSAYIAAPIPVPFAFIAGPAVQGVIAASEASLFGFQMVAPGFAPGSNLAILFYDAVAVPGGPFDPFAVPPALIFQYDPNVDPRFSPALFFPAAGVKFSTGIAFVVVDFSGGGPPQPAYTGANGPSVMSFLASVP